ncbi:MAG: PQQ-binding-like beta-propeller repeat protein [Alphaproteobacteria bacterium]
MNRQAPGLGTKILLVLTALLFLSGCGAISRLTASTKDKLPGQRVDVQLQPSLLSDQRSNVPVQIDGADPKAFWSQSGANAQHKIPHIATDRSLSRLWSKDIGSGTSRKYTSLAEPLIIGNVIFTMDSTSVVRAISLRSGSNIWSKNVRSTREKDGFFGGGITYDGSRIFVTTGFSQVLALNAKSGQIIWRKGLTAPARSAGTVSNGRLFVQTVDNKITAYSTADGRGLWRHSGTIEQTGIIGTASPAVAGDTVVAVFSSGEIFALSATDGSEKWSDTMASLSGGGLLTELNDIRAHPVIDNGQLILVSNAGRTAVFNLARGTQIWQTPIGGSQTPVVSGNQIFVMGTGAELTALNRQTGQVSWQKRMKNLVPKRFSPDVPLAWFGPLLAGNKLIVVSAEGQMISVNPVTGRTVASEKIGGKAVLNPVGSAGFVLFTTSRGRLVAYR